MYNNWLRSVPSTSSPSSVSTMYSTIKELLDAIGCTLHADLVLEHIQNNRNYGNSNITSKQIQENVMRLAKRAPDSKEFLTKYEALRINNAENLPEIIDLIYNLMFDEKKTKSTKPKVAPKPPMTESKIQITKEDLPQIRDKLLKAVDEGNKLVMKTREDKERETRLRPAWYNTLNLPNWYKEHPAMSWDFSKEVTPPPVAPLAGVPLESQEAILVEDMLYVLEGVAGRYIVPAPVRSVHDNRTFTVSDETDDALKQMVQQMLPLAADYSLVRRFVESCDMWSGRVLHALVAAIDMLLKDYYMMIAQLESEHLAGHLTLQKLWYFVLPTSHTMRVLANIVRDIAKSECRGGAVLSILHEKTTTLLGDTRAQEISLYLTEQACRPYMDTLDKWLHRGTIYDPFQEFMVEDNELINKDELPGDYSADYWEKRYTVRAERVPCFLRRSQDVVLRTGKYLNVISQCGKPITKSNTEEIKYSLREQNYNTTIQKAYAFASKSLLELLLKEYDLMGRLKSVKNYFLMSQGDFVVQFMDATEQELQKNIDDIIPSKLESLLGLCLRLSAASQDPYNEDMRVELLPYDLQFQMFKILSIDTDDEKDYKQNKDRLPLTGIETFSFGMEVKWPVSLILNHKAVACYQMMFRHLFYCKHVERLLCRVWLYNKVVKKFAEGRLYAGAFALRQRMLGCLQHLQYYMCIEVIEPSWCQLIHSLDKVNNVDEVLERHGDFLEACLGDCMLTSPQLLKAVTTLCNVCVQFCTFIQKSACGAAGAGAGAGVGAGAAEEAGEADSFGSSVARYELRFTAALLSVLAIIDQMARDNNTNKLLNLTSRLNFNTFYDKQLDKMCAGESLADDKTVADSS